MSEEAIEQEEETTPKSGRKMLVIALTIGLIAGAATGSLVVGPVFAEGGGAKKSEKSSDHGESGGAAGEDCAALLAQHGVTLAPAAVYTIENVVVNPANSGGTRFLMASVAFGLTDLHGEEQMTLRDAEVRDIVVGVLSSRSVAQLSDISSRNGIKEDIRTAVVGLVGEHSLTDVYFPQFVIQ